MLEDTSKLRSQSSRSLSQNERATMKTIKQIADLVGVSKVTVYRYIKAQGIQPTTEGQKSNTNYYNEEQVKRIRAHFETLHETIQSSAETLHETIQDQGETVKPNSKEGKTVSESMSETMHKTSETLHINAETMHETGETLQSETLQNVLISELKAHIQELQDRLKEKEFIIQEKDRQIADFIVKLSNALEKEQSILQELNHNEQYLRSQTNALEGQKLMIESPDQKKKGIFNWFKRHN